MNVQNLTFLRNLFASQEFAVVSSKDMYISRDNVRRDNKPYTIYTTTSAVTELVAGPMTNSVLSITNGRFSTFYLVHARRVIEGMRLHTSLLDTVPYEFIVRFSNGGRPAHGIRFDMGRGDGVPTSYYAAVQNSKNYDDCGVRLVRLDDGYPAFTIDGWLADYREIANLNPVDCLDYTRRKVEENGGRYRRDRAGRYIR